MATSVKNNRNPSVFELQNIKQRLLWWVAGIWLVTLLAGFGSIIYFLGLSQNAGWGWVIFWFLLVGALSVWATAYVVKRQLAEWLAQTQPVALPTPSESSPLLITPKVTPQAVSQPWPESNLQQLEEKLKQTTQTNFDGLLVHEKVKILGATQKLAQLFDYAPTELVGMTILELATPESHSILLRNILLKYEKPYEIIGLKKDGATLPVEILSRSIPYGEHEVRTMTLRKISERDQAEIQENLRRAKQELDNSLDKSATQLRFSNERLRLELYERERMQAELKIRARQQAAVAELGQRALAGGELAGVLDDAAELVSQTLEVKFSAILKFLADENVFEVRTGTGWQPDVINKEKIKAGADSHAGYALLTGEPVVIEELRTETRFTPSELLSRHGIISSVSVIIQGRDQPFGVLAAHSNKPKPFTKDDIHFLQAIANVLASAIERKEAETQLIRRNQELLSLQSAGAAIMSSLDFKNVLKTVTGELINLLGVETCIIFGHNQTDNSVSALYAQGVSNAPGYESLSQIYYQPQFSIKEQVLTQQLIRQMSINQPQLSPAEHAYLQQNNIKSRLILPMVFQGRVIGVVDFIDSQTERRFSEQDIALARLLANQAAGAIENARLFEKTQTALQETAALFRVSQTLAQLGDEQQMFEFILKEYLQYLGLQQGGVLIFDKDKAYGTLKAHMIGGKLVESGLRIPAVGNPSYDQLIENKAPVIIFDVETDPLIGPARQLSLQLGIKSLLLVPIITRNEVIGVLGADSTGSTRDFTPQEIALVEAMANQLGVAIENTRLYTEAERRAEQLAVLRELDRAITTSLRLDDIHYAIARHTSRLLPYDRLSIAMREGDKLQITYTNNLKTDKNLLDVGLKLPRQTSAIGWVVTQGQPLLRHNINVGARYAEDEQLIAGGIQSSMVIPLRIKSRVLGTLNLGSKQVGAYSPDDLEIAQAIADQLAIAIENARLFQQARQEINERKKAETTLEEERARLTQRVEERTADLQTANLELARAARLKDEFLASMSHELRTPLTAILGLCDVLKMQVYGDLSEKQIKAINDIEESGRHLLELINDILDLSKIEAGKLELQIAPVLVQSACQTSLQFVKQAAHKKKISLSLNIDEAVTIIQADDRRLKQILVNLLSNAVKFTPEKGAVGLDVIGDSQKHQVHFVVWDTGIGIAKEDIDRLFQPFVQVDSSLTRQYPGTGLGLALVKRMVRMHGGETHLESELGQGTRFTVSFPWDNEKKLQHPAAVKQITTVTTLKNDWSVEAAQPPLILVAEDDIRLYAILTDYLRAKGFQVIGVRNGLEAIEQAKQKKPDVILMDIQMPQVDGLEATRRIRTETELTDTPIIVLTALAMAGDKERCLEAGANAYVSKPLDFDQLIATIQTQLA